MNDSHVACTRCGTPFGAHVYELRRGNTTVPRCFRCALLYAPMLRRSLIIAIIVGTLLTAINQGNLIAAGDFPGDLIWKVPLTYTVPFCVATTGALLNARTSG